MGAIAGKDGQITWPGESLRHFMEILADPKTFSLGIHIRAGDEVIQQEGGGIGDQCSWIDSSETVANRVQCIALLAQKVAAFSRRVLVIFSDSHCVKTHLMDWFRTHGGTFTDVWTQQLTAGVNIDHRVANDDSTWKQTLYDWTLMRYMSMFGVATSYTFVSGFPASALVTSDVRKPIFEINQCKRMPQEALCASRFC